MINKMVSIWVEINANRYRITDKKRMEEVIEKCAKSGIGTMLLAVKDTSGYAIYKSKFLPHYSLKNDLFEDFDYLKYYIEVAKKYGVRIIPCIDVFAEGGTHNPLPLSPAYVHPEWQTTLYCVNEKNEISMRKISENPKGYYSYDLVENFFAVFVNPALKEVRDYEASIVKELVENYDIEGVCLDRVRYVGISADFSDASRELFEQFIGHKVENWPTDVMTLTYDGNQRTSFERGPLWSKWECFRASNISAFVSQVRDIVDKAPRHVELWDYTGNWYDGYDDVAANWAADTFKEIPYYAVDPIEYAKQGYAKKLDVLLSGTYYVPTTIEDAKAKNGNPKYTIEGGCKYAKVVTDGCVPVCGSLGIWDANDFPEERVAQQFDACLKYSDGCMIFDLCYVDDRNLYEACNVNRKEKKA